ncbi:MAG: ribonuclease R [Gemmatimonadetes bacterium]|nr:ribonuclease R [Gemmatimonadota bacterium]
MRARKDAPGRVLRGSLSTTRRGDAFVRPDDGGTDVFVPAGRISTAMDGDRVAVRIDRRPRARNPEGTVIDVLERARSTVVGTYHRRKRVSFVVPLDQRLQREVLIAGAREVVADDGDVVVVRLTGFGSSSGRARPTGTIERVLGPLDDPGVDVLAVAHGFDLSLEFSDEILAAGEKAAAAGTRDQGAARIDRTDLLVFTIDPADAKDHDDALSIEEGERGHVEVGIHIADVSHFVTHGGAVDMEARARGTSVYLVDRTIPMLPPVLSSDVCSLIADVPRLALSLFVELDGEGRVRERRYERTLIRCRHGLSYEDAQDVLDGKRLITPQLDEALRRLDDFARKIRSARHGRGALDLDIPEAKVILDADGNPVDIQRRDRRESHRLIEDFMILANEVVASDLVARDLAGLFRVHEPPSPDKAEELRDALAPLGLDVPRRRALKPADIQRVLEAPRGPEAHVLVSTLVLRTLAKARYDVENLGHFGLASTGYTHFTSPIRRYPDLLVHRVLAAAFVGGTPPADLDAEMLAAIAATSSQREQAADEAERATVALKKVEFMERHLGDEFDGRVSGVATFGVFVTLEEYFVDGLLHVRALEDDYYRFSPRDYALIGERKGRRYRLGDRIRVQVARVDKEARHIDFVQSGRGGEQI